MRRLCYKVYYMKTLLQFYIYNSINYLYKMTSFLYSNTINIVIII